MATYYKYAERSAEDYIDWGAIGKTMSDTLLKEQQNRDKMKAEIDAASREFGEVLSNSPQGAHRGMNEYANEFAGNAQASSLMMLRNLKEGKLALKDYLIFRENLKQGANDAFDIIGKYNDKYGEYQQSVKDGVASKYQTFLLGEVEGFGNLTNTSLYINPTNGKVSAGKRALKDPSKPYDPVSNPYTAKMSEDPNEYRSLVDLNFALSAQIDKYDSKGTIASIADSFADTYEAITERGARGAYTKVDDIRQLGKDGVEFKKALEQKIRADFRTNPIHTISSLVDWLQTGPDGEPIGFTRNPNEANAHTILLKPNPEQPEGGTDVMDENAEGAQELLDFMMEQVGSSVMSELNRKIEIDKGRQPMQQQKWQAERLDEKKRAKSVGEMLSKLRVGNAAQVKEAEQYFVNTTANFGDKSVIGMDRTDTGVVVTYAGGNTQDFNWKEGTTDMTNDEWLRSASSGIAATDDYQNVVSGGSRYKNKGASTAGNIAHKITIANPRTTWNTMVSSARSADNLTAAQDLGAKIGITVERATNEYGGLLPYYEVYDAASGGKPLGSNLRSSQDIINVIEAAASGRDLTKYDLGGGSMAGF